MSLTVLCPSRGRVQNALELRESFFATRAESATELLFVVDDDDPTRLDYPVQQIISPSFGNMNGALGWATKALLRDNSWSVLAFVGDDMRLETKGFDTLMLDLLTEHPGVAYGDDLLQGERLATNWWVSRPIVEAFGMSPIPSKHLFIDDAWMRLAGGAGCLYFCPDVIVRHLHPSAGLVEWDEGHRRVNAPAMYEHDGAVFHEWVETQMAADIERLKGIVG